MQAELEKYSLFERKNHAGAIIARTHKQGEITERSVPWKAICLTFGERLPTFRLTAVYTIRHGKESQGFCPVD